MSDISNVLSATEGKLKTFWPLLSDWKLNPKMNRHASDLWQCSHV